MKLLFCNLQRCYTETNCTLLIIASEFLESELCITINPSISLRISETFESELITSITNRGRVEFLFFSLLVLSMINFHFLLHINYSSYSFGKSKIMLGLYKYTGSFYAEKRVVTVAFLALFFLWLSVLGKLL